MFSEVKKIKYLLEISGSNKKNSWEKMYEAQNCIIQANTTNKRLIAE